MRSLFRLYLLAQRFWQRRPPLHPILFGLYPVFSLYSLNIDQVWPSIIIKPLGIILLTTLVLWGLFAVALKGIHRSAVVVSLLSITFFSYGYISETVEQIGKAGVLHRAHYVVIAATLGLIGLVGLFLYKKKTEPVRLSHVLDVVGFLLLAFPILNVGYYMVSHQRFEPQHVTDAHVKRPHSLPDIYYIILDGHARQDVLKEVYGENNGTFIDHLKGKGFYIADQSRSNYTNTFTSLASSLNMDYLDVLWKKFGRTSVDRAVPTAMIQDSGVEQFLRDKGYQIVHFGSDFVVTQRNPDADFTFDAYAMGEFGRTLFQSTAAGALLKNLVPNESRNVILYNLKQLKEVPKIRGPKFVFCHFVCPHFPYLFDRYGNETSSKLVQEGYQKQWSMKREYFDQLLFMDSRIAKVIDTLLSTSATPPVIILQSDHGPAPHGFASPPTQTMAWERTAILNAIYLPQNIPVPFYATMTPVNTFALLFNSLFQTHFPLKDDRVLYAPVSSPYNFVDVTHWPQKPLPGDRVHPTPPVGADRPSTAP